MRFQLNFAAVVRNVAVMANVAILAVVRFVAVYQSGHHTQCGFGTTDRTEKMRGFTWLYGPASPSDLCDPSWSSSTGLKPKMNLAFAVISPEREITGRQLERLLSKRRRDYSLSTICNRG